MPRSLLQRLKSSLPAYPVACCNTLAGRGAALAYAKQHFQRYQARFMRDIQRLMGCLLYYGKPLAHSEYRWVAVGFYVPSWKQCEQCLQLCCDKRLADGGHCIRGLWLGAMSG